MSALSRMASRTHRNFAAGAGDTVLITASVIPGNERMVYSVINSLMRMGCEVYYEQDEDLHVSGHASQEELKLLISLTRPKFFMPIHGEYRHLRAHARIAGHIGHRDRDFLPHARQFRADVRHGDAAACDHAELIGQRHVFQALLQIGDDAGFGLDRRGQSGNREFATVAGDCDFDPVPG